MTQRRRDCYLPLLGPVPCQGVAYSARSGRRAKRRRNSALEQLNLATRLHEWMLHDVVRLHAQAGVPNVRDEGLDEVLTVFAYAQNVAWAWAWAETLRRILERLLHKLRFNPPRLGLDFDGLFVPLEFSDSCGVFLEYCIVCSLREVNKLSHVRSLEHKRPQHRADHLLVSSLSWKRARLTSCSAPDPGRS